MKKILLLLLCLVLSLTMLVACDESEIGDYEYPDYVPNETPLITLDMYIIVGEETEELAIDSVERMLSQYTETNFKTKLNLHYIEEAEYKEALAAGIGASGDAKADIILVNSKELMDELVSASRLHDLTEYYDGTKFGRLNTMITSSLIEASRIGDKLYSVPNDHVVGEYTYLLINEAQASSVYNFSPEKLLGCKSLEDETVLQLKAAIEADGKKFEDYVSVKTGNYADKVLYESQGYICNVVSYPSVTAEDAFSSCFSIVKGIQYPERAMEIIYLLSSDATFRNLLQYGVEGINYIKDDNGIIVPYTEGDGVYNMNMLHTGNIFLLNYSAAWTAEMKNIGLAQNKESVVFVDVPEVDTDSDTEADANN